MKRRLGGRLRHTMYSGNQGCCGSTGVTLGVSDAGATPCYATRKDDGL
jgi:hypothetical protein